MLTPCSLLVGMTSQTVSPNTAWCEGQVIDVTVMAAMAVTHLLSGCVCQKKKKKKSKQTSYYWFLKTVDVFGCYDALA